MDMGSNPIFHVDYLFHSQKSNRFWGPLFILFNPIFFWCKWLSTNDLRFRLWILFKNISHNSALIWDNFLSKDARVVAKILYFVIFVSAELSPSIKISRSAYGFGPRKEIQKIANRNHFYIHVLKNGLKIPFRIIFLLQNTESADKKAVVFFVNEDSKVRGWRLHEACAIGFLFFDQKMPTKEINGSFFLYSKQPTIGLADLFSEQIFTKKCQHNIGDQSFTKVDAEREMTVFKTKRGQKKRRT